MKAIVHIGTEKTGTTSIQQFLHQNRRKLRSAGYHLLRCAGKKNNRALPAYCIDDDKFDDFYRNEGVETIEERRAYKARFLNELKAEVASLSSTIKAVVISSEHFHSRIRTTEEMDNVQRLLSTFFDDIRIICYLREQATTCASYYSTDVQSGGEDTFYQVMSRCTPENYYYNYFDMLANWERCFGPQTLDVALFDKQHFLNGDLLDDFTARLDPGLLGKLNKNVKIQNESLSPSGQILAMALNRAFPVQTSRGDIAALRGRCKKYVRRHMSGKGQQPSPEVRQAIFEAFIPSNELLRKKFFPEVAEIFAPPSGAEATPLEIDDQFVDTLSGFLAYLRREGRNIFEPGEYSGACLRIAESVHETIIQDHDLKGKNVFLDESDARMLKRAADRARHGDLEAALHTTRLARDVYPWIKGVRASINRYEERLAREDKYQIYRISYVLKEGDIRDEQLSGLGSRLQVWLHSLDLVGDGALHKLEGKWSVTPDGEVQAQPDTAGGYSYTMISTGSLEEALAAARECPYLELGFSVEVSRVDSLTIR